MKEAAGALSVLLGCACMCMCVGGGVCVCVGVAGEEVRDHALMLEKGEEEQGEGWAGGEAHESLPSRSGVGAQPCREPAPCDVWSLLSFPLHWLARASAL